MRVAFFIIQPPYGVYRLCSPALCHDCNIPPFSTYSILKHTGICQEPAKKLTKTNYSIKKELNFSKKVVDKTNRRAFISRMEPPYFSNQKALKQLNIKRNQEEEKYFPDTIEVVMYIEDGGTKKEYHPIYFW